MKDENAIEVRDVTKSFKVYLDRSNNIKDYIIHGKRRRYENRQVLKGISFEVKKGEAIGLIGHNGCGKSTTLKLLTRIMYPDTGTIEIKGRVSSLIELGAGFHPDMSGRENIFINASIFGLSKKEIEERVDDIIEFSELEEFIDNPVRTYSSGMYMRLAFAVAINVDAEVLLIDEILAVGDIAFQAKCFRKLKEIKALGTTIVIVSHALGQIEQICETSYWIHEGVIKMSGDPKEVHPFYLDYMENKGNGPLNNPSFGVEFSKGEAANRKKYEQKKASDNKTSYLNQMKVTEGGVICNNTIALAPEALVYGPYVTLTSDCYILEIDCEFFYKDLELSITKNGGKEIILRQMIADDHNVIEFPLKETAENVEFVIRNGSSVSVKIMAIDLK